MNRALIPATAVGAFSGGWLWWWHHLSPVISDLALQSVVRSIAPGVLRLDLDDLERWVILCFQIGGAFILAQNWREIVATLSALLRGVWWLAVIFCKLVDWLIFLAEIVNAWSVHQGQSIGNGNYSTERVADLTWSSMAGAAAVVPAGPALPVGSFVLAARPPDWDEVFVASYSHSGTEALCRTTSPEGTDWAWVLLQIVGLHLRLPVVAADGSRTAPVGVDADAINWVCIPPDGNGQWKPTPAEIVNVTMEGNMIVAQFNQGNTNWPINIPGVGGPLIAITATLGGPVAPGGAAGAVGGGGVPVGGGLGIGGGHQTSSYPADLRALEAAVQQLQSMAISPSRKSEGNKKKKKKKKSKKSRKGHRKSSRSSSSSSSSSQSRSRSSKSSSSGSRKTKPLRWREKAKDRRVEQGDLTHVDMLKFKKRGDLVAFAARHPGALTAHFLAGVYQRLSKGTLNRSSQLREPSVTAWAHQFSGLTEIRDIKEVVTLSEALDAVNRREIAQAMDILCQRILAIQAGKTKGGSWERAEAIELVNNTKTLASSSMLALTNN